MTAARRSGPQRRRRRRWTRLTRSNGQAVSRCSQRELFNTILDELKLKLDRDGNVRTAYSLRHTYICFRLMEGADIYQIAKNCRTSVEMIEKFYAAHIKTMLDAARSMSGKATFTGSARTAKAPANRRSERIEASAQTDEKPRSGGSAIRAKSRRRRPSAAL